MKKDWHLLYQQLVDVQQGRWFAYNICIYNYTYFTLENLPAAPMCRQSFMLSLPLNQRYFNHSQTSLPESSKNNHSQSHRTCVSGKFQRAERRVPYQCQRLCFKSMNIQSRGKGKYNQLKILIQDLQSFVELHQIDCQHF